MNKARLQEAIDRVVDNIIKKYQGKEFVIYPDNHIINKKYNMNERFGKEVPLKGGDIDHNTFKKALLQTLSKVDGDGLNQILSMLSKSWSINLSVNDLNNSIMSTPFTQFDSEELYQILYDVYTVIKQRDLAANS